MTSKPGSGQAGSRKTGSSCTIAIAGKGGTGKTTFAALLVKYLLNEKKGYILAVDGDPSSNLNLALGMELAETVGHIREDMATQVRSGSYSQGIPKTDYLEYRIQSALVEGKGVDLIAMGRPEGPGCYCAANNILRAVIDRLGNEYDYVVIDNEAGMEHISRQTTRHIDILFIISDPTVRGLSAAEGIAKLATELGAHGTRVSRMYFIINRWGSDLPVGFLERIRAAGLELIGTLPNDPQVGELDLVGRSLIELDEDSPLYRAAKGIFEKAGI